MKNQILPPTAEELSHLYDDLSKNAVPVALLSTVPKYADEYVSASDIEPSLPRPLNSFYSEVNRQLSSADLKKKCQEVFSTLSVTKSEALYLEHVTQKQSGCLEWFDYRVGRITASNAYAAVRTNPDCTSESLIKKICITQYNKVMAPALEWGRSNEEVARKAYLARQASCSAAGLVVNAQFPHLGLVQMGGQSVTAVDVEF